MNYFTLSIGILVMIYAIWIITLRIKNNGNGFKKLEAMKDFWGDKLGIFIHVIFYIILPFACGLLLIKGGIEGTNLFDIF